MTKVSIPALKALYGEKFVGGDDGHGVDRELALILAVGPARSIVEKWRSLMNSISGPLAQEERAQAEHVLRLIDDALKDVSCT